MINIRERISRLESLFTQLSQSIKSEIRVSLPCKVIEFDPQKQTISCIPLIRELLNINGKVKYVDLPVLKDVPIQMPRAGNWAITLPIKEGDECMVIFQDMCIDGWWFRGGVQNWNDLRRHDLSDAIAIFSPWSQPNTLSNYSTNNLEIRSLDGKINISLGEKGVNMSFPQGYSIEGDGTFKGNLSVEGDVIANGVSLKNHTHGYKPGDGDITPTTSPQGGSK